ncbi:AAA family ATPase [Shouchella clausii]|uniref:deoxynucleotide monophosphate kinase family protein n=1 Tax=Shouchella clausii TaxID=79880 RepID=UPI001C72A71B|nr:AAA family ATPase [Shouchella clausii]MBX0320303.1 AAA family ATPase [Shouchella clausii]MEB5480933.1 AAA family ATPase [Shouchella clausii]
MNIGITGKIRSGKDTVGRYLVDNHSYTQFAFGTRLKEQFFNTFPWMNIEGKKPRKNIQMFGQQCRAIDPEVWVKQCFQDIDQWNHYRSEGQVVITDIRQPNEFKKCKEEGYFIIRVEADEDVRIKRMIENGDVFEKEDLYHETELSVDKFDVDLVIDNNGTLEQLIQQIKQFESTYLKNS